MKELDNYISALERRLLLLSGSVRRDIVDEVRGHLEDSTRSYGGGSRGARRAIAEFGPPGAIARQYNELYEPGPHIYLVICAIAAVLAVRSHPFLEATSSIVFALLALLLVFASIGMGKRLGVSAAIAAVVTRLVQTGYIMQAYPDFIEYSAAGMVLFLLATLLLVPIGYFPGTLRERLFQEDIL